MSEKEQSAKRMREHINQLDPLITRQGLDTYCLPWVGQETFLSKWIGSSYCQTQVYPEAFCLNTSGGKNWSFLLPGIGVGKFPLYMNCWTTFPLYMNWIILFPGMGWRCSFPLYVNWIHLVPGREWMCSFPFYMNCILLLPGMGWTDSFPLYVNWIHLLPGMGWTGSFPLYMNWILLLPGMGWTSSFHLYVNWRNLNFPKLSTQFHEMCESNYWKDDFHAFQIICGNILPAADEFILRKDPGPAVFLDDIWWLTTWSPK